MKSACLSIFMSNLPKTIIIALLLALIGAIAQAQVAKKTAKTGDSVPTMEGGAKLAESGHCAEALPLLKKSFPQTSDKDLKLRIGFDAVRCAMSLSQFDLAVDFLRMLNREFPRSGSPVFIGSHLLRSFDA